ncbi:unnamed protein product [Symbiodinium natans]|uniref:Saposin B-type domain-containing protein n=1 Tax=Symbiodinium natans TaxID=878477 RepID=A0A812SDU2_9DINO|nr:unnamed protein product [Symbiodinium natans]
MILASACRPPLITLLFVLLAGCGQCHDGSDDELLAAIKRQMDSVPEPPVDLRQIPKELRCTYCNAIASTFTIALEAKSKALPRSRQGLMNEEEYIHALQDACEKPVRPGELEALPAEARHLTWLCRDILQTLGEEDIWELFRKHAQVPAVHLCSKKLRLCPKDRQRKRGDGAKSDL